jgi:hypothetical protein
VVLKTIAGGLSFTGALVRATHTVVSQVFNAVLSFSGSLANSRIATVIAVVKVAVGGGVSQAALAAKRVWRLKRARDLEKGILLAMTVGDLGLVAILMRERNEILEDLGILRR